MIIKKKCKHCNKQAIVQSEIPLDNGKMLIFECGHSIVEEVIEAFQFSEPEWCETHQTNCVKDFESDSGKHLFPYQAVGIEHIIDSNARDLIADEMGLGKTIQALGALRVDKELTPALVVCKSIAKGNWMWEIMDWLSVPPQVLHSSKEIPFEAFPIHVVSYDLLSRLDKTLGLAKLARVNRCSKCGRETDDTNELGCKGTFKVECNKCEVPHMHVHTCGGEMILKKFQPSGKNPKVQQGWFNILERCKTIIVDETHLIKNPEAKRSKTLKRLVSKVPHIIGLSGTPIKNSATEYFTILNMIKPEKFYRYNNFCWNHVRYEYVKTAVGWSQKFTGLSDPEGFKEMTQDYILRRTTDEVAPELPKLFKSQQYVELEEDFKAVYDKSEGDFAKWFDTASKQEIQTNLLAQLAKLRHQTSLAKIDFTIDTIMTFLGSTDRKLAIFTHHIDARDILAQRLDSVLAELGFPPCLILTKSAGVEEEIEKFKNSDGRIIILSTLAHGESINLQFCADSVLHERQWNPSNEDQAISGRFRRIGQEADKIRCSIPVALGTIDEYFVDLVERKRTLMNEALSGETADTDWNQTGFMGELAEMIASKGREKWKLEM